MTRLRIADSSYIESLTASRIPGLVLRNGNNSTRGQKNAWPLLVACCLILIASGVPVVHGLKLLQVSMPSLRLNGESARLLCQYDLEDDALYSVKWYKGGREFYRYVPRDYPPMQVFPLDGVTVDKSQSDQHQVTLMNLALSSSGRYKCEVSVDAPSFQTSSNVVEMNVIYLPRSGPKITLRRRNSHDTTFPRAESKIHAGSAPSLGKSANFSPLGGLAKTFAPALSARARQQVQHFPNGSLYHYYYEPGEDDVVELNCTSGSSKPAAALEWYVDGMKVRYEDLIEYAPFESTDSGENGDETRKKYPQSQLETTILGLRWKMPSSSENIVLNCTSAVSSVYWSWTAIMFSPETSEFSGDDSNVSGRSRPRTMYQGISQYRLKSSALPISQSNVISHSVIFLITVLICLQTITF